MIQKNFFKKNIKNAQNRSIQKVIWLKSIFQCPYQISPITRWSEARLINFSTKNFSTKNFFFKFAQNASIRVKNMFSRFSKSFPK